MGGDNELMVSIRKSVAATFAREHLTDLVRKELTEKEMNLRRSVVEEVNKVCLQKAKDSGWATVYELTGDIKAKIRSAVEELVTKAVSEEVSRQSAALVTIMASELEKLRERIPNLVTERVTNRFNREVSEAMDARLKELRNLLPADPPESRKINVP